MPFTFSHPALILPFRHFWKKYFSVTGLVIGSIVPDFEYFLRMKKGTSYYAHSLPGIFYFNLPLALLLFIILHAIVRQPLILNSPPYFSKRLNAYLDFNWLAYLKANIIIVILSVLIGILTHYAWDWLTHITGDYIYEHQHELLFFSSWLHHSIIYTSVHAVFSALGLWALLRAFNKLPINNLAVGNYSPIRFWSVVGSVSVFTIIARLFIAHKLRAEDIIVSVIASFLLGLLVACWVYRSRGSAF